MPAPRGRSLAFLASTAGLPQASYFYLRVLWLALKPVSIRVSVDYVFFLLGVRSGEID